MKKKTPPPTRSKSFPWPILLAVVLVAAAAVWVLTRPTAETASYPAEVSVNQAYDLYQEGTFVLDVREQSEWDQGHIPGASLIPLGELPDRLEDIPADTEVVVVCRTGNRSATGRDILRQAGFAQTASMAGGMVQWQNAGYPVVSGP